MYKIPLYKQKLFSIIKERYNLKSNAQAGQKIRTLIVNINHYIFWRHNPLCYYITEKEVLNTLEGFRMYLNVSRSYILNYVVIKNDVGNYSFSNPYVKFLYHIYNCDFILP